MASEKKLSGISQQSANRGGASSVTSGDGNLSQNQNVTINNQSSGKISAIVVPLLAAIVSGVGGAYAAHQFALKRAPIQAEQHTQSLIRITESAIDLAKSKNVSPDLLLKLQDIFSQAEGVQANLKLISKAKAGVDNQADFWLPAGKGVVLGESAPFGVRKRYESGSISVTMSDRGHTLEAGERLSYETKEGASCFLIYLGESPDARIFGFKILCG